MKSWWIVALGVVIGFLGAGVILLASQPPRGNPITLLPPPTSIPIQIHIIGEVKNPGVYDLPISSRVQDAINAAGGLTHKANSSLLNLAAPLEDGTRIQVPSLILTEISSQSTAANSESDLDSSSSPSPLPAEGLSPKININSADQAQLETLSGIGPVIAQKILTYREENGPFLKIEEIQKVSGIGPAKFEMIRNFISVNE